MNFNIRGIYTFKVPIQGMFLNEELCITNTNLITLLGEAFFLNRCVNNEFSTMSHICLGNGSRMPSKSDFNLGNELIRKKCLCKVDLINKQIILTASFRVKEILGTSEIGVCNDDGILISHDVYQPFDILGAVGDVEIQYIFQFTSGSQKTGWIESNEGENIYYVPFDSNVVGVLECNTQSGYRRVNSIHDLKRVNGAYYYDFESKNLYIRTTRGSNPINDEIIVQV